MTPICDQCKIREQETPAVVILQAEIPWAGPASPDARPSSRFEYACLWHWGVWELSGFSKAVIGLCSSEARS